MDRKHMAVEYDPAFDGGDYNKVGQFVYIPLDEVCEADTEYVDDDLLHEVFERMTGMSFIHIIHIDFDNLVTATGECIRQD